MRQPCAPTPRPHAAEHRSSDPTPQRPRSHLVSRPSPAHLPPISHRPFFIWKDIFERCLSPDMLTKLAERTALFQPSSGASAATLRPPEPPTPRQRCQHPHPNPYPYPNPNLPLPLPLPLPLSRWQHAVATILAYLYPPGVLDQVRARARARVRVRVRVRVRIRVRVRVRVRA